ncbi:MAG: hypothetical protein K6G87_01235 [Butyrivibrio sp.]|uniref:hypothetical protein n=1 Tax=Butyrivibrio sp. TaxID=28121 RepID=UPI0025F9B75C|nr:hypothetical protein [Butyrivibrio sp.]MCR5769836.1 hypothetical protein [Butyrivibrio sp.]
MNITTTLIKKYLGEMLSVHGFEFKGMRGGDWEFVKDTDEYIQSVTICKREYDNLLFFELYADSRSGGCFFKVKDLNLDNFEMEWHYSTKEDVNRILIQMAQIIDQYGIPEMELFLEKVKNNYIYTDAMAEMVYYEHEKYAKAFIEENKISENICVENAIKNWFQVIGDIFDEVKRSGNIQDLDIEFVKIASFIGERIIEKLGGKWELHLKKRFKYQKCYIVRKGSHIYPQKDILADLEDAYNQTGIANVERMREDYIEMFMGR